MFRILAIVLMLFSPIAFSSWDGAITGKIATIDVVAGNGDNYGFRVKLVDNPKLCGTDVNWAYINESDGNYQVTAGLLLAAKLAYKEIVLYSKKTDPEGYCRIGYVILK